MDKPKLRDSCKSISTELYPLNEIPFDVVKEIVGHIVYLSAVGRKDITGDDFGDALAKAVGGTHFASPVGIADVAYKNMCWSVKTVKQNKPFTTSKVRLISGRNSPIYSFSETELFNDIQKTGSDVLQIWNERVNIAAANYNTARTMVLVRNNDLTQFSLFEEAIYQFSPMNYKWSLNKNMNLIGTDIKSGEECFTWQPHGSQFTIHTTLPGKVIKFSVNKTNTIDERQFLINIGFNDDWIHILK